MSLSSHQPTNDPAFLHLQREVARLLAHARRDHPLGVTAYTPAAFGEAYPALYLRDFTYMAESAPEYVPAAHVRAVIELLVRNLSSEGHCPERITNEGEVIYVCHGARPAGDSPLFLAKLCRAYARQAGETAWLAEVFPALAHTLATVTTEPATGLVWIDPANPHTAYGFTDTIAITGRHLYCSLLLFEACGILAEIAGWIGHQADADRYQARADQIRANLPLLWSPEHQLFFAGSHDCRQADVWGSAYACVIGAVDAPRHAAIAHSLLAKRDRFLLRAQVRHLLVPEFWQRRIVEADWTDPGEFQNGAYWGTATGWVAETIETVSPGTGIALLRELAEDFASHGIWECIGPRGYTRVANNLSSVCLPYASWKRLRGRDEHRE